LVNHRSEHEYVVDSLLTYRLRQEQSQMSDKNPIFKYAYRYAKESNAERILIWKSDLATIQKNIPLGSGTGDIKDELIQTYLQYNYTDLAKKNLNAHNQFFQTAITLGLAGIIAIIACFTIPLYIGFRSKNIILLSFIIITIINFSVESMLEVQAGTIFFSFFYVLLLKHNTSPT